MSEYKLYKNATKKQYKPTSITEKNNTNNTMIQKYYHIQNIQNIQEY